MTSDLTPLEGGSGVRLEHVSRLPADVKRQILHLADVAEAVDNVGPLDDQVRSEIMHGLAAGSGQVVAHVGAPGVVVAYCHVAHDAHGATGHLVVHPERRRQGTGAAIVDHVLSGLGADVGAEVGRTLRLWAHGNLDGARALAAARGFHPVRELRQMHLDLAQQLPLATYPDDVIVRTFEPGRDADPWVTLNAAAFAGHPEQDRLTVDDLHHRMSEPWFDSAGFFLAERAGRLIGSHWTKVHSDVGADVDGTAGAGVAASVGEVYAVGVDPDAQGLGLGKALTLTGLHHLQDSGLGKVMLYVDGDNDAATTLYERLGFTTSRVDVVYASS